MNLCVAGCLQIRHQWVCTRSTGRKDTKGLGPSVPPTPAQVQEAVTHISPSAPLVARAFLTAEGTPLSGKRGVIQSRSLLRTSQHPFPPSPVAPLFFNDIQPINLAGAGFGKGAFFRTAAYLAACSPSLQGSFGNALPVAPAASRGPRAFAPRTPGSRTDPAPDPRMPKIGPDGNIFDIFMPIRPLGEYPIILPWSRCGISLVPGRDVFSFHIHTGGSQLSRYPPPRGGFGGPTGASWLFWGPWYAWYFLF